MMCAWQYRSLDHTEEFEQFVDLEVAVWQLDSRDAVPTSLIHALVSVGGLAVGAYDADRLVGLALAFPGRRDGRWILWSHMVGVHPDYQNNGVGFGLKQFQRTWALEHGYKVISWTFDPLQSGNANFNLHCLGAVSCIYHVNFYGEMVDGINAGLPSDRLEVVWNLSSPHVKSLAIKRVVPSSVLPPDSLCVLRFDSEYKKLVVDLSMLESHTGPLYVEIPNRINWLKQVDLESALSWRLVLREALQLAFSRGYVASDSLSVDNRCFYVLTLPAPWFLYVVECSDGSLYTGVTPNVDRRLVAHNAGRGAAYTASRCPVNFVAAWRFQDQGIALRAERAFKKQTRSGKLNLIALKSAYLGGPFVWFDA
jgi:predicted GNAT superfamily acetyltransferase/predicted GIY-YIG superfamily endonuclease